MFDRIFSTGRPQGVWSSDQAARRAAARVPDPSLPDRVPLARGDGTVFIPLAGFGLPGQRQVRQATPAGVGGGKVRQPIGAGQPVGGVLVRPATQAYWARGPSGAVHTYPMAPVSQPGPDGRLPSGAANLGLGRALRALRRSPPLLPPGDGDDDDEEVRGEAPWPVRRPDPLLAHEMLLEARARAPQAALATACRKFGPGQPGRYVPNHHLGRNMCPAARAYQQKVTKALATHDYVVVRAGERADFDGYDATRCVLLDAKLWPWDGKHAQALRVLDPQEPKRVPPSPATYSWALRDVIGPVIDRARRQARVAGGRPIEWHVSDAGTARLLHRLMAVTFGCPCGPQRCLCPIKLRYHAP
ncbi:Tox-REase-5 domain-containing protein [Roseomonas sp. KE2513]|uniref:Tox-REase-5 domain-containing protein n=1 Tax=Roseomonas sp. KE2513 TaxID=2479202 RepID=UPI0018DF6915|nr:Tox-REase-5 domain-containing protein [Roseomonas sp. KE2513]